MVEDRDRALPDRDPLADPERIPDSLDALALAGPPAIAHALTRLLLHTAPPDSIPARRGMRCSNG